MEFARLGSPTGQKVDPDQFLAIAGANYKEKGIYPYCEACGEPVDLYGVFSTNPNTTPRFDHKNLSAGANPLNDCVLANRNKRLAWLLPDGFDDVRGERIRQQFREPEFMAQTYNFCLNLCRVKNLTTAQFRELCQRADKKRIWAYEGIQVWAIPYILLVLGDFTATRKDGSQYDFRFVFQRPRGSVMSALWENPKACRIKKVFGNGKKIIAHDNPYPVSQNDFESKAGKYEWVIEKRFRLDWVV